jgi:hypothetical protein
VQEQNPCKHSKILRKFLANSGKVKQIFGKIVRRKTNEKRIKQGDKADSVGGAGK